MEATRLNKSCVLLSSCHCCKRHMQSVRAVQARSERERERWEGGGEEQRESLTSCPWRTERDLRPETMGRAVWGSGGFPSASCVPTLVMQFPSLMVPRG